MLIRIGKKFIVHIDNIAGIAENNNNHPPEDKWMITLHKPLYDRAQEKDSVRCILASDATIEDVLRQVAANNFDKIMSAVINKD